MFQQEIKETVQQAYAAIATDGGERVARRHYSDHELAQVPPGAVRWALGMGDPVRYARLQPSGQPKHPRGTAQRLPSDSEIDKAGTETRHEPGGRCCLRPHLVILRS
jgi:hypothetical protein